MKHWGAIFIGTILALMVGMGDAGSIAFAGSPMCTYVAETGHNIHGPFLTFYRAHNGELNIGKPLTEAFWENGFVVQYFTLARLELHPENPEPYRVQLGLLGTEFGVKDPPIRSVAIPPASDPNFMYFPPTGQMISFGIKIYFEKHGGLDVLGYPITGIHFENGKFVQYFQRARLEWDPIDSNAIAQPSPVGQITLDKKYPGGLSVRNRIVSDWCSTPLSGPSAGPTPTVAAFVSPTPTRPDWIMNLKVRVQIQQTGMAGPQIVEVSVEDQNAKPIADAALYAVVHFSNGDRWFPLMPSDKAGMSSFIFDIGVQPANSITTIEVKAFAGGVSSVGRGSFSRHN